MKRSLTRWRPVSVAVVVTVALAGLSACSSHQESAPSKTLNVMTPVAPISFNPTKSANGGQATWMQELAYEPVIDQDAQGKLIPGLATSWGYIKGKEGRRFEFTLRKNAKFSDGSPVTAAAVAASINYFAKGAGPSAGSYVGITAQASGATKVLVQSATANPVIADLFTPSFLGGNIIGPKGLADPTKMANATFGAGPYVYDATDSVAGDHYVYTPNKYFYDKSQIHFKKVVFKVIANAQSALQALRTGQVDFVSGDTTVVAAAKSAKLRVQTGTGAFNGVFLMDWKGQVAPALGEKKVRQALNYAIDRKAITKAVYGSYGTALAQPNTPGWDAYSTALDSAYSYNPAKAKKLLAEAGYPDGFTFSIVYTSFAADTTKIVQAMVADYAKIGVTMTLVPATDLGTLVTDINSKSYSGIALEFGGQSQFANTSELWSKAGLVNPFKNSVDGGFDAAFDAYLHATDATRAATAQAVQKIVVDQGLTVPVALLDSIFLSSPSLKNLIVGAGARTNNIKNWSK